MWVTDRKEGVIMKEFFPQSYVHIVNTHSGKYRRNRRCLIHITHTKERVIQSDTDDIPFSGEVVGVHMTENGHANHQEEGHVEENQQSEKENSPEGVQSEGSQLRVVLEQTYQEDDTSRDHQITYLAVKSDIQVDPRDGSLNGVNKEWTNIKSCALFWNSNREM